jgi:hypothetical protein
MDFDARAFGQRRMVVKYNVPVFNVSTINHHDTLRE